MGNQDSSSLETSGTPTQGRKKAGEFNHQLFLLLVEGHYQQYLQCWVEGNPAANVLVVRNAQKCRGLGKDGHTLAGFADLLHQQRIHAGDTGQ